MEALLEKLKHQYKRIILNLGVMAFFLAYVSGYVSWGLIDHLEHLAYDARLMMTMPNTYDNRIVILDIDEESLGVEGRWPWPRVKLANLIDTLFDHYGVAIVGFDVVFAEPDKSSGLGILEKLAENELSGDEDFQNVLKQKQNELNYDALFAKSLEGRPVILGYYFTDSAGKEQVSTSGKLPDPTFRAGSFKGRLIPFIGAEGYGANLEIFQDNAITAGHFNPYIDEDGVVRRVTMLYEHNGAYYESLSLAIARVALGVDKIEPVFNDDNISSGKTSGMEWLKIGERLVPVDERVRTLVPYHGLKGSFPYIPATDVLHKKTAINDLKDTIVLVGTSAPGLLDLRSAPVQKVFPGVEIHANLISGIIDNNIIEKPAYTLGAEFIVLALAGLTMLVSFVFLGPGIASLVTILVISATVVINYYVWTSGNLVLPIASTLLLILFLYLLNMSYGFFVESRGKRQLAGVFGQYVPPELVDEMGDDPESYSLDAKSEELTVLFSDVRGFTTISEGLDPGELSELMNQFLTPLTGVIHRHRGTIDKYMGDAIMAFWGAPIENKDHAREAMAAAMESIKILEDMQPQFQARGWPEIRIGVGLNTGPMSVGNMGSEFRLAYTVMGDAVNLGSRLEGLTRQYGVDIIVSETTSKAVPEYIYRELDRVRVKGKDEPVIILEPVGLRNDVDKETRKELKLYIDTLKLYRQQNWDMAELQFLNLQKMSPDRMLYKIYVERVAQYRKDPPGSDWDGVYTFKTK